LSDAGKLYRDQCIVAIWDQFGPITKPLRQKVRIIVEAIAPDRRERDLDNCWKALLDAITAANVWASDSLISDERMFWSGIEKPGKMIITIEEIIEADTLF